MKRHKKLIAVVALVGLCFAVSQCGFLLHPERKGQKGGDIDVPVLIMDCLWLVVGIVPGVVALVVDFYTGCIYESGTALNVHPGQEMGVRMKGAAPADAVVEVSLNGPDGSSRLLMGAGFNKGDVEEDVMTFTVPADLDAGTYQLAISVNGATNGQWPVKVVE